MVGRWAVAEVAGTGFVGGIGRRVLGFGFLRVFWIFDWRSVSGSEANEVIFRVWGIEICAVSGVALLFTVNLL